MRLPLSSWLALAFGLLAVTGRAYTNPEIIPLGHDTFSLTRFASTGFARNTEKLKEQALEDAAAYCAKLHKELKIVSSAVARPRVPLMGIANAKIIFKALDANDPELHAPAAATAPAAALSAAPVAAAPVAVESVTPHTATDAFYSDLLKLDDLRKRGLLTEEEFQAKRKKLVETSN